VSRGGSREEDDLNPAGEYAMSCLGRERIFDHFCRTNQTKMTIIRLNYASELRYGVLLDIAQNVYDGRPVSLSMGYLNTIWQRDASAMSLGVARARLDTSEPIEHHRARDALCPAAGRRVRGKDGQGSVVRGRRID
jgi:hypothetical protein